MGFVENVKGMLGFDGDYDENYQDEGYYDDYDEYEEEPKSRIFQRRNNKVIPMSGADSNAKIVVLKPKCFNNSTIVADELRRARSVVIDVGALDSDEARRVIDFVSGAIYGMDGNLQKITTGIFVATPNHVDIMGEIVRDETATVLDIM